MTPDEEFDEAIFNKRIKEHKMSPETRAMIGSFQLDFQKHAEHSMKLHEETKEMLWELKEKANLISGKGDQIFDQVKKTNGRVNKLEDWREGRIEKDALIEEFITTMKTAKSNWLEKIITAGIYGVFTILFWLLTQTGILNPNGDKELEKKVGSLQKQLENGLVVEQVK